MDRVIARRTAWKPSAAPCFTFARPATGFWKLKNDVSGETPGALRGPCRTASKESAASPCFASRTAVASSAKDR